MHHREAMPLRVGLDEFCLINQVTSHNTPHESALQSCGVRTSPPSIVYACHMPRCRANARGTWAKTLMFVDWVPLPVDAFSVCVSVHHHIH